MAKQIAAHKSWQPL